MMTCLPGRWLSGGVSGSCVAVFLLCCWVPVLLLLLLSCARCTDSMFDANATLYLLYSRRGWCGTMLMFGVACPVVRPTVVPADEMFAE
jgi:hypothetical protein